MTNFKNFANDGMVDVNSSEFTSIRHRQIRETKVGSRIERVWATDFERCANRKELEKYISKYSKYESNKYVSQALARINALDAVENARIAREEVCQRIQRYPVVSDTGGDSRKPPKFNIVKTYLKALILIIFIGGCGLYSYNRYKQNTTETSSDVMTTPLPSQYQDLEEHIIGVPEVGESNNDASSSDIYTETSGNDMYNGTMQYNEPSYNSDNNYREPVRSPCIACRGTGDCPVCKGNCQTQTKMVYHYDGNVDLEWEQCKSCGGSGRHQGCGGDGWLDEGADF